MTPKREKTPNSGKNFDSEEEWNYFKADVAPGRDKIERLDTGLPRKGIVEPVQTSAAGGAGSGPPPPEIVEEMRKMAETMKKVEKGLI